MRSKQQSALHRPLWALSVLGSLLVTATASAQDIAAAEALFNRGLADMTAGHYETGCKALAESHRIDPRPGTLFTLATCEARWGHVATAVTRYGDYLEVYDRLPEDRRASQGARQSVARSQRDKLAAEVPQLTLSLPPDAPAGTIVKRNGEVVARAAHGVALPVDPGEHTVSTQAPGGALSEQRITLARGEKKQVTLEVKAAPRGQASPGPAASVAMAPEGAGTSGRRMAALVIGGTGIAGLLASGVMGGLALEQKGRVDQNCGVAIGSKDPLECNQVGMNAQSGAKAIGIGSTIGFALGFVGIATAVVLVVSEPKTAKPVAGARGRWLSAGVLSAGPAGALVGAQGAW